MGAMIEPFQIVTPDSSEKKSDEISIVGNIFLPTILREGIPRDGGGSGGDSVSGSWLDPANFAEKGSRTPDFEPSAPVGRE
jgi:hypothetical protein